MNQDSSPKMAGFADQYMKFEASSNVPITWCEGCGNFGIQNALKRALALKNISRKEVLFCYDVGCVGNGSDKIEGYTIHGLHGRVLPLAAGISVANSKIKIIAEAGDGGTLSEGIGHLIHSIRNNYNIIFIHHDNQNYGLTTGQASATTPMNCKMNANPDGVSTEPINHLDLVLSLDPSLVIRSCSSDIDHMTEMFCQALDHDGFVFFDVFQACPTYNRHTLHEWYLENFAKLPKNYDSKSLQSARELVQKKDKVYGGIIYQNLKKASFNKVQNLKSRKPLIEEVENYDVAEFIENL